MKQPPVPRPTAKETPAAKRGDVTPRAEQDEVPTMRPCPMCNGSGLVSPEVAAAWHAEQGRLVSR